MTVNAAALFAHHKRLFIIGMFIIFAIKSVAKAIGGISHLDIEVNACYDECFFDGNGSFLEKN